MSRLGIGLFGLGFAVASASLLFGAAGRWDLPMFWAYLSVWLAAIVLTALTADLDLMRERLRPAARGRDNLALLRGLGFLVMVGHWVLAGLDVGRYHWSIPVPAGLQFLGLLGLVASFGLIRWAQHVNRFFSSALRIQRDRGHHVITSGPYSYVRHPGYAAFILAGVCSGLVLGSWPALLFPLGFAVLFIRRAAVEDRLLKQELEGYAEYAALVRYRLVPGLW
jgi:protein-S-isoprenylcysteine O-methyltransferase Ste14